MRFLAIFAEIACLSVCKSGVSRSPESKKGVLSRAKLVL